MMVNDKIDHKKSSIPSFAIFVYSIIFSIAAVVRHDTVISFNIGNINIFGKSVSIKVNLDTLGIFWNT